MFGNREVMQALHVISHQVRINYDLLRILLKQQNVTLPPELIQAGIDLGAKTKALQAALESAQAQQPT